MLKNDYTILNNYKIDNAFYQFIEQEVIPGLNIEANDFFLKLLDIVDAMQKENTHLLAVRDNMQHQIDEWHCNHQSAFNSLQYQKFLQQIGYLLPEPDDFSVQLDNVDTEIADIAGPQLVVPITSARFVLNAVNARWGSLYDALYSSDVIANEGETALGSNYNPVRGACVVQWAYNFLDKIIPLSHGSYAQVTSVSVVQNALTFILDNGHNTQLKDNTAFVGIVEMGNILVKNNKLHIELVIDSDTCAIKDILLESAITTIIDFEDSVSTVSKSEKIQAYRHFLGLMKRALQISFNKNGVTMNRAINKDKSYITTSGQQAILPGTSLMLVRNVGHHMFSDLIKTSNDEEVGEGIIDAMTTVLIGLHDLKHLHANSKTGSMYIVKPKMHGPDEVAFTVKLFTKIEQSLNLEKNTLKVGIMDEERRTSVNLKACIKAAKNRIIFINTGFLDRTGDEIHTSMLAGAMVPKNDMKDEKWIQAYEQLNVQTGLRCGFYKQAQIGKGMWTQPDLMHEMLTSKIAHLNMGANCAWVPSPTAATLHATHYHQFDIFKKQIALMKNNNLDKNDLLAVPLLDKNTKLDDATIEKELHNNAHSILGYVVKWINQGVGCSKVQNINHVSLMEDRATLRISSQHMTNWLYHKICTKVQVNSAFEKMAKIVDEQNKTDHHYKNMAPSYDGNAYLASLALVFEGKEQPNGYTETILKKYRQQELSIQQKL